MHQYSASKRALNNRKSQFPIPNPHSFTHVIGAWKSGVFLLAISQPLKNRGYANFALQEEKQKIVLCLPRVENTACFWKDYGRLDWKLDLLKLRPESCCGATRLSFLNASRANVGWILLNCGSLLGFIASRSVILSKAWTSNVKMQRSRFLQARERLLKSNGQIIIEAEQKYMRLFRDAIAQNVEMLRRDFDLSSALSLLGQLPAGTARAEAGWRFGAMD